MAYRIDSKVVRGDYVELVESSGFLGGIEYQLIVDGRVKEQSKDLDYIRRSFDNY